MGEAFSNIQMGPGCAYFPTVSLALNEAVVANFGGTPLKYPIEGFAPPQLPPTATIIRVSLIFTWFHKLLDFSEEKRYNLGVSSYTHTILVVKQIEIGFCYAFF